MDKLIDIVIPDGYLGTKVSFEDAVNGVINMNIATE